MNEYYQNGMFSVENELFYENNKRLGYFEDEEKEEILQNNHEKTVDRLNELRELNIELKRNNKELRKAYDKLRHRHSLLHDNHLDLEIERDNLKQYKKEVAETLQDKFKERNNEMNLWAEKEDWQGYRATQLERGTVQIIAKELGVELNETTSEHLKNI